MTRTLLFLCLVCVQGRAADPDLNTVLRGVEARYNRAKTLQVLFTESYTGQGRPRQSESGQLTLRKPGRMRWDYTTPPGKLFLSDGKQVYIYNPVLNQVEKMPLKASEDMRAPLAFLLGKLDFSKEFRDIQMRIDGAGFRVTALAQSDKLPYDRIDMLVSPDYAIQQLIVNGQDQSVLTFHFDQEKLNPTVDDARFKFVMPRGATLVTGESGQ
ncbi:MAG: outer membrane lipoprotein chaperone LolA [Acidobacteriaceae bacterium]|nr:outer membrane lipoprotein chaperone LolA [Acidobacteriaceae bacterium]